MFRFRLRSAFWALSCVLAPRPCAAAIVDTLSAFDDAGPGWAASVQAGFSAQGGNTELLEVASDAKLQWQGGRHRLRMMGGYARQTSSAQEVAENALLHLRHNARLVGRLHSLEFVQLQRNPFQRLRSRTLFGVGGRLDVLERERLSASLGLAHMVEVERLEDEDASETAQRLSTFFLLRAKLSETASLRLTAFGQPSWSDFGDTRAIGSVALEVDVTRRLSLEIGGGLQHDSEPPTGVEATDWKTSTALKFEL